MSTRGLTLAKPVADPVVWSAAGLEAADVLRGLVPGTVADYDLLTRDGLATSQTIVLTRHGPVVLLSWVPDEAVPEAHRITVRQIVNRVRRRLNLPAVTVRYFGPPVWTEGCEVLVHPVNPDHPTFETSAAAGHQRLVGGLTGRSMPWTISLHAALRGDDLARTVAHEIRHCDQLWGRAGHVPEASRESDATRFAEEWMATR